MVSTYKQGIIAVGLFGIEAHAQSGNSVPVGQLAAQTGPTSPVSAVYAKGVADAIRYINEHGGIDGKSIMLEIEDYGYESARAAAIYDEWLDTLKPVAIQGWGTADTEALVDEVARDEIVYMSGSSAGELTDPTGRSPRAHRPHSLGRIMVDSPSAARLLNSSQRTSNAFKRA